MRVHLPKLNSITQLVPPAVTSAIIALNLHEPLGTQRGRGAKSDIKGGGGARRVSLLGARSIRRRSTTTRATYTDARTLRARRAARDRASKATPRVPDTPSRSNGRYFFSERSTPADATNPRTVVGGSTTLACIWADHATNYRSIVGR